MNPLLSGVMMATAGVTVFAGSVVGLLAVSGRLTPAGVKDVPVLKDLIKEEPGEAGEGGKGSSVGVSDASAQGGSSRNKRTVAADRIEHKSLFTLESFAAPTTQEEIREILAAVKEGKEKAERDRAVVQKREYELDLREADLEHRRRNVEELMRSVSRSISDLKAMRAQFEADITLLKTAELKNIKRQATTLATMEPEKASEFLIELGPDKEDLAVKLLVSMDPEAASEILGAMEVRRGARLIERATRVIQRD